jgi:hypothetical protein
MSWAEASGVLNRCRLISFQLRNTLPLKERVFTINTFCIGAECHFYNECRVIKFPVLFYAGMGNAFSILVGDIESEETIWKTLTMIGWAGIT